MKNKFDEWWYKGVYPNDAKWWMRRAWEAREPEIQELKAENRSLADQYTSILEHSDALQAKIDRAKEIIDKCRQRIAYLDGLLDVE